MQKSEFFFLPDFSAPKYKFFEEASQILSSLDIKYFLFWSFTLWTVQDIPSS